MPPRGGNSKAEFYQLQREYYPCGMCQQCALAIYKGQIRMSQSKRINGHKSDIRNQWGHTLQPPWTLILQQKSWKTRLQSDTTKLEIWDDQTRTEQRLGVASSPLQKITIPPLVFMDTFRPNINIHGLCSRHTHGTHPFLHRRNTFTL